MDSHHGAEVTLLIMFSGRAQRNHVLHHRSFHSFFIAFYRNECREFGQNGVPEQKKVENVSK